MRHCLMVAGAISALVLSGAAADVRADCLAQVDQVTKAVEAGSAGQSQDSHRNSALVQLYIAEEMAHDKKEERCLAYVEAAQKIAGLGAPSGAAEPAKARGGAPADGDKVQAKPGESWFEGSFKPNQNEDSKRSAGERQ